MKGKIIIIADRSGSISESGKSEIEMNAIRAVRTWCVRNNAQTEIYAWRGTVKRALTGLVPCSGSADPAALEQFCGELPSGSSVLLLSDGSFTRDENAREICRAAEKLYLFPVAVGADADRENLRRISGWLESDARVYEAAEVLDAVRKLSFRWAVEAGECD